MPESTLLQALKDTATCYRAIMLQHSIRITGAPNGIWIPYYSLIYFCYSGKKFVIST